jgi:Gpi18-like mannosyltransferase
MYLGSTWTKPCGLNLVAASKTDPNLRILECGCTVVYAAELCFYHLDLSFLQRISKVLGLLIRQIAKSISNSLLIFSLTKLPIPSLVLPAHP